MSTALPFPAVVTSPAGDHWPLARARIVTTPEGDRLEVFAYHLGAVRLVGSAPVAEVSRPARTPLEPERVHVHTDGETDPWVLVKGSGCGCGHPAKRATTADLDRAAAAGVYTRA